MGLIEGYDSTKNKMLPVQVTDTYALKVSAEASTAIIGKVAIDQVTAHANEVVTKTGSVTALEAGTAEIGNVKNSGTFAVQSTLQAGTALVGKVGIDQTTPGTTNKVTTEGISASAYSTTALAASGVIKASAGKLIGISGINNLDSAQYIQVFDSDTVPADTGVPVVVISVAASSNFSIDFSMFGLTCATGISWSNSSTLATKTIGAADCWMTAIYI